MGRVAGLLFLVGSAMTMISIVFPHSPKAEIDGFWAIAAATGAIAAVLFAWSERLPSWSYQAFLAVGSVIVSLAIYFNGERHGGASAGNQVLYLWIALYSGYFFTRAQLLAQLVFVAAIYAATLLVVDPGQVGFTRWFITVGMVAVAGGIVHVLRGRNDDLVARLYRAARTDLLTGLVNRQGFDERFEHELERARRSAQPLALVLADIDGFKEFNDRFGHPAGDVALAAVGHVAGAAVREIDTMARFGGDEFAAILPITDAGGAFDLAERVRVKVSRVHGDDGEPLTMSFGIVEFPRDGQTRAALIHSADRALYEAKALGRNRSVIHRGDSAEDARRLAQSDGHSLRRTPATPVVERTLTRS
jgi:diguanylate cyclase (GGDEF)-like protein